MKRYEIYLFQRGLNLANFKKLRGTYAVNKNKRLVKEEIEDMEKGNIDPSKEMKEYQQLFNELSKKYCVKDNNGEPKMKNVPGPSGEILMAFDIPDSKDPNTKYSKEVEKLKKKYKDAIEEHEKKVKAYNEEFLMEDSEFKPFMVDLDVIEEEECPQKITDLIYYMIKE